MNEICPKMYIVLHVSYPLFLSDFNWSLIFWINFRKLLKCQVPWKSVQWESKCCMRPDGQTWGSNFAYLPKKQLFASSCLSVHPSVRQSVSIPMEQPGSRWTDIHEIWYWILQWKSVERIQNLLKAGKRIGQFFCEDLRTFYYCGRN